MLPSLSCNSDIFSFYANRNELFLSVVSLTGKQVGDIEILLIQSITCDLKLFAVLNEQRVSCGSIGEMMSTLCKRFFLLNTYAKPSK